MNELDDLNNIKSKIRGKLKEVTNSLKSYEGVIDSEEFKILRNNIDKVLRNNIDYDDWDYFFT